MIDSPPSGQRPNGIALLGHRFLPTMNRRAVGPCFINVGFRINLNLFRFLHADRGAGGGSGGYRRPRSHLRRRTARIA